MPTLRAGTEAVFGAGAGVVYGEVEELESGKAMDRMDAVDMLDRV